jgi:hypothetical protein
LVCWTSGRGVYEQLRAIVLAGGELGDILAARRFARRGLGGLISWPASEPEYLGSIVGARRPPWCGSGDSREQRLRDVYGFLLADRDSYRLRAVGE